MVILFLIKRLSCMACILVFASVQHKARLIPKGAQIAPFALDHSNDFQGGLNNPKISFRAKLLIVGLFILHCVRGVQML